MDINQEREIIEQIKAGDEFAFQKFYEEYKNLVFSVCFRFIDDKDEADDISQDIFVKIYQAISSFRFESKFSTWIYRIALNHCLNSQRKKKRYKWLSLDNLLNKIGFDEKADIINESSDIGKAYETLETNEILNKAINSLPEKQKTALILNKFDELTNKEIAEIMECPLSSVDSLIFRAKKNLSEKLINLSKK